MVCTVACAQDKQTLNGETEWQKEMNAEFKDASKSPLKKKDLKKFKGLDFFKFDSTYVVKAVPKNTPDSEWFKMKTTTSWESEERVFGVLTFELKGQNFQLNVYQGKDLMTTEGYEDYLFLPFLDDTNGEESYGGGDVPRPKMFMIFFCCDIIYLKSIIKSVVGQPFVTWYIY